MHVTRVLLDAEALLLASMGVQAVIVPQAFARTLAPGMVPLDLSVLVPVVGAVALAIGAMQRRAIGLAKVSSLRTLLQGRMVTDLVVALVALLYGTAFRGGSSTVLLGALSFALVFAAIRFYALIMIGEDERFLVSKATVQP